MADPIDTEREAREASAAFTAGMQRYLRAGDPLCPIPNDPPGKHLRAVLALLDAVTAERDRLRAEIDKRDLIQDLAKAYISGQPEECRRRAEESLHFTLTEARADCARLQALLDAECLARQTAERERDEARTLVEDIGKIVGVDVADLVSEIREVFDARPIAAAELARLWRERDEARAMAPRWVAVDRWFELRVGDATIGMISPYVEGTDWASTTTMFPTGDRCVDRESAARAVCARLGLFYIEVPRG